MNISGLSSSYERPVKSGLTDKFIDNFTSNFTDNKMDNRESTKEFERYLLGVCPCCKSGLSKHGAYTVKCCSCEYSRKV